MRSRCAAFVWLVCWCSLFHASQKDSCMAEAATVFEIDLIFVFEFDPIFVFQNDPIFVFQNDPSPYLTPVFVNKIVLWNKPQFVHQTKMLLVSFTFGLTKMDRPSQEDVVVLLFQGLKKMQEDFLVVV